MDADSADDKALLENTPTRAESLLHSMEKAAGGIYLSVNANKTREMCFKRERVISTRNICLLKLVDKFMYCVSSSESDVNLRQAKMRTAINRLLIIYPIK